MPAPNSEQILAIPTETLISDIPRILGSSGAMVCLLRPRGNAFRRQSHIISSRSDVFPSGEREIGWFGLHQDAAFLLSSITFDPCAAHAGAGGARNRAISGACWKIDYAMAPLSPLRTFCK